MAKLYEMEDITESTEDYLADDLQIASQNWKRVMNTATKNGYREGVQDGADSVLQEGFEIGFKDGFETAFILGKYKALATVLSNSTSEHPPDITSLLNKTRRGECWICSIEQKNEMSAKYKDTPFPEILCNQRAHCFEVTNKLHKYFKPLLKESKIEI